MKKHIINTLTVLMIIGGNAQAVTIVMDRGTATGMVALDSLATRVPSGNLIRWGTVVTGNSISAANFVEFATTTMSTTTSTSTTGGSIRLDVAITGVMPSIAGKQVLMWVYDGATASTLVDQGLFTSVGWVLPTTFATNELESYNLVLGQNLGASTPAAPAVTSLAINNIGSSSIVVGNVQNTPTGSINNSGYIYTLGAAVPEPSTAFLGALGALVLLRRRRN